MTRDELLEHCVGKPGAWLDEPWENDVVVKVGSKIFAFLGSAGGATGDSADGPAGGSVGVKCGKDRLIANEWLLRYPQDASVMSYIGRYGWNTLRLNGKIPDDELFEAIDSSYDAVVSRLPKKERPAG